jgi:hypothetical protein
MKLFPKKDGNGLIGTYSCTIGSKEARDAGFLDEDGKSKELEKTVDAANGTITIRVKKEE